MATAKAICTCATCGASFTVTAYKSSRSAADSWESWAAENYDECDDCRGKRVSEANRKAKENAEAAGLPRLTGSEKQITWANTLRDATMKELGDAMQAEINRLMEAENCEDDANREERKVRHQKRIEKLDGAYDVLMGKTKCSWWIEHGRQGWKGLAYSYEFSEEVKKHFEIKQSAPVVDEEVVANATVEMTVSPEDQTHSGSAEITVTDSEVSTIYVKDEQFRLIVKGLGYSWKDGKWRKQITVTTGSAAERAAELGNKLLNAGFAVRIADEDIRSAAVDGRYEPQTYRWITVIGNGENAGKLFIRWGENDDLYKAAKAITGAKYVRPGVAVSAGNFAQIEDFAVAYGFKFSAGAKKALEDAKAAVMVVRPAPQKDATYEENPISDVLNTSADVLDDLKD